MASANQIGLAYVSGNYASNEVPTKTVTDTISTFRGSTEVLALTAIDNLNHSVGNTVVADFTTAAPNLTPVSDAGDNYILISNATAPQMNGIWVITAKTVTSVSFTNTNITDATYDQAAGASGSIDQTSVLTSTNIETITYVNSGKDLYGISDGVIRLSFASTVDLSSVAAGQVAVITGSTKSLAFETFTPLNETCYILGVDDTNKYIDVYNAYITGAGMDESSSTSATLTVRSANKITFETAQHALNLDQFQAVILEGTTPDTGTFNVVYSENKTKTETLASTAATSISHVSGNTMSIDMSGATPDLSNAAVGQTIHVSGAVNPLNNGAFTITSVNDGTDVVEYANPNISDSSYDETTGASADIYKYVGTVTVLEETFLGSTGSGDEKATIPDDYYEMTGTGESLQVGDTLTNDETVNANRLIFDAQVTERTGEGGVDLNMKYSQMTHDLLSYGMGNTWGTEVDITGTDVTVVDSYNIQLNDSLGSKIFPGHIIRLSGSTATLQVGERTLYPNNGYFVVQQRIGDQAPYTFKLGKSYSYLLEGAQLLIVESGNSSLRLQSCALETGTLWQPINIEKFIANRDGMGVPYYMLFGGQVIESLTVTVGTNALVTMSTTFVGKGLINPDGSGTGRYNRFRGRLVPYTESNTMNAASEKMQTMRNGVGSTVTSYTLSLSGLAGKDMEVSTPYATNTFLQGFNCATTTEHYFSDPSRYNVYMLGCKRDEVLCVMETKESCETGVVGDAYAFFTPQNIRSGGELGTMARDGSITESYGSSIDVGFTFGSSGDPWYRSTALTIGRFSK